MRQVCVILLISLMGWHPSASFAQSCVGPGDLHVDGQVDSFDFAVLFECLGGPDGAPDPDLCPGETFETADSDSDGDADLQDFARFSTLVGSEYFVYGPHRDDAEAEILAIEISDELHAPEELYQRIHGDLLRIRAAYPETTSVHHYGTYSPTRFLVRLDATVSLDAIRSLNSYYHAIVIHSFDLVPGLHLLSLCDSLNVPRLVIDYEALPEVLYAEPDGYGYIEGPDVIHVEFLDAHVRYVMEDGSGDCPDRCYCFKTWTVDVSDEGDVTLVSYVADGDCR